MRPAALFLCALIASQTVLAQRHKPAHPPVYSTPVMEQYSNTIEVSTHLFSFNYSEVWDPPAKSNESGFIPGFAAAYTYRGTKLPLFGQLRFEYTHSQTTYDGSLISDNGDVRPFTDKSRNRFSRVELLAGYGFTLGSRLLITPYAGYGYRSWVRILADPGGYEEDYSWSYLPVGARADLRLSSMAAIGFDASVRFMFNGKILQDWFDVPTLDLGSKVGFRIALPSSLKLSPHWGLGIEPYFEYSGIKQSNEHHVTRNYYVWEPESSTHIFGTNLSVRFSF